ncbi:MAG: 23S rRNA (guanosine(2251)-2'-O)-methyltransferase RlmB [Fuerstiella sp.]
MADRSHRRKSRKKQLQASHQKNWLTGRHAVTEALTAGIWPIVELYLAEASDSELPADGGDPGVSANDLQEQPVSDEGSDSGPAQPPEGDMELTVAPEPANHGILTAALERDIEPIPVSRDRLTQLCGSRHHQGVAARMGEFPYRTFDQQFLEADSAKPIQNELVVVCDRIQDSHNFGAILRCCDGMNVAAVVVANEQQAAVSPTVARSSAGAVNHVPIVLAEDLCGSLQKLKAVGYHIAAATEKTDQPAWAIQLPEPTVLVIGSEAKGVDQRLLDECDSKLMIPMLGHVSSLNAAVATGILLYEIRRRSAMGPTS